MFKKLIAEWDLLLANIAIITAGAMMMAMQGFPAIRAFRLHPSEDLSCEQ